MLFTPMLIMNVAAFRPDRSPEITMALTDLAWILFVTPIGPFIVQNLAIALAVFSDQNTPPVFPRWVGYANIWVALLFCAAAAAYFFKAGPLAWQGIFAFWLGLVMYTIWAFIPFITLAPRDSHRRRAVPSRDPTVTNRPGVTLDWRVRNLV